MSGNEVIPWMKFLLDKCLYSKSTYYWQIWIH